MAPSTKSHTDGEWLSRQATILDWLIKHDLSYGEVRDRLLQDGFQVSKSQLEYKLRIWGFRKNIGEAGWQYIDHHINKRRRNGKKTQVLMCDRALGAEKVCKETNRYRGNKYGPVPSPEPPSELHLRFQTPPQSPSVLHLSAKIDWPENIPWLHFHSSEIKDLAIRLPPNSNKQSIVSSQIRPAKDMLGVLGFKPPSMEMHCVSRLTSMLRATIPEQYPGQMAARAGIILHTSNKQAMQEQLMILLFHLSNKSIPGGRDMNLIVDIIERSGIMSTVFSLDKNNIEMWTTQGIFEMLFQSSLTAIYWRQVTAHDICRPKIVALLRWLLKCGQSARTHVRIGPCKCTPLQIASRDCNYELCNDLLERGADPNEFNTVKNPFDVELESNLPPLFLSIKNARSFDDINIIRLLLDRGASVGLILPTVWGPLSRTDVVTLAAGRENAQIAFFLMEYIMQYVTDDTKSRLLTADVTLAAAWSGHLEVLRLLHECGVDVTRENQYGLTGLHTAAFGGHVECCKFFISLGMQIDGSDASVPSSLHLACSAGSLETVKFLHGQGANHNRGTRKMSKRFRDRYFWHLWVPDWNVVNTPIGAAFTQNRVPNPRDKAEVVSYLLACGTTPPRDAVVRAAGTANPEALEALLSAGADLNQYIHGQSLLSLALNWSDKRETPAQLIRASNALLDGAAKVSHGDAVRAVRLGDWDLVERILQKDEEVISHVLNMGSNNEPEPYKLTFLEAAILTGDTEIIRNALARDPTGYSPGALCAAALVAQEWGGNVSLMFRLVENLPHGNSTPIGLQLETTALGIASYFGHSALVDLLLNQLPLSNARLPLDHFPEHINFANALKFNPSPRRYNYKPFWWYGFVTGSVVAFALQDDHTIAPRLLDHGYKLDWFSVSCMKSTSYSYQGASLFHNSNIFHNDHKSAINALRYAVFNGNIDAARLICSGAQDIHKNKMSSWERQGPLCIAIQMGDLEIVEILLDAGFNPCAPAAKDRGLTELQTAAIYNRIGIAKRLIEFGADVNAPAANYSGRTALEAAGEQGHVDMIAFLLDLGVETTGIGQRQYLRAIGFAERQCHFVAAKMLRSHRPLTEVDDLIFNDAGLLFESYGSIDTDSEYTSRTEWYDTDDETYSYDAQVPDGRDRVYGIVNEDNKNSPAYHEQHLSGSDDTSYLVEIDLVQEQSSLCDPYMDTVDHEPGDHKTNYIHDPKLFDAKDVQMMDTMNRVEYQIGVKNGSEEFGIIEPPSTNLFDLTESLFDLGPGFTL